MESCIEAFIAKNICIVVCYGKPCFFFRTRELKISVSFVLRVFYIYILRQSVIKSRFGITLLERRDESF